MIPIIIYFVPGTILSVQYLLVYWIFWKLFEVFVVIIAHFMDEKTEACLLNGRTRQPVSGVPREHTLHHNDDLPLTLLFLIFCFIIAIRWVLDTLKMSTSVKIFDFLDILLSNSS